MTHLRKVCFMASSNSMTKWKYLYQDLVIFLVPHGQPASGHRDQNPLCLLLCGGTRMAQCCKTSHLHCSMCRKLNRRLINNGWPCLLREAAGCSKAALACTLPHHHQWRNVCSWRGGRADGSSSAALRRHHACFDSWDVDGGATREVMWPNGRQRVVWEARRQWCVCVFVCVWNGTSTIHTGFVCWALATSGWPQVSFYHIRRFSPLGLYYNFSFFCSFFILSSFVFSFLHHIFHFSVFFSFASGFPRDLVSLRSFQVLKKILQYIYILLNVLDLQDVTLQQKIWVGLVRACPPSVCNSNLRYYS